MAAEDGPDSPSLRLRPLGEIYEELGTTLLRDGDSLGAKGDATRAASRYEEAARAFSQARREGGNSPSVGLGLARAREQQGQMEQALRAYLEVVRLDPASAETVLSNAYRCLSQALARSLGP